mmetsp:Transcript_13997/g.32055  ORF Transcript_13997/g.32055 Transcript_13997/m.32055 type:complete len:390 (+) Transcript_13997:168-1337(+)
MKKEFSTHTHTHTHNQPTTLSPLALFTLLQRLLANNQVHGCEDARLTTRRQVVRHVHEHAVNLLRALGRDAEELQNANDDVVAVVLSLSNLDAVVPVAVRRVARVRLQRQVRCSQHLEANLLRSLLNLRVRAHVRQSIAVIDALDDLDMTLVVLVEHRRRHPLVRREVASRLEHAVSLLVHILDGWRVARSLDGVAAVEAVVLERHLEEVALDHLALLVESRALVVAAAALHLVVVDGDARDVSPAMSGNDAHRATDAAPNVERLHALLEPSAVGDVVLVHLLRRLVRLALHRRAEMEALSPSPLVDVRDKVVEGVDERGSFRLVARLDCSIGLREVVVVRVPVSFHLALLNRLSPTSAEVGCARHGSHAVARPERVHAGERDAGGGDG